MSRIKPEPRDTITSGLITAHSPTDPNDLLYAWDEGDSHHFQQGDEYIRTRDKAEAQERWDALLAEVRD